MSLLQFLALDFITPVVHCFQIGLGGGGLHITGDIET
jgi:hypothetical protein